MFNPLLELYRFIAAIIILCHHSYLLEGRSIFFGGYLLVEFFFILTGYFTVKHLTENRDRIKGPYSQIAASYTFEKIKRILPFAYVGIFLGLCKEIIQVIMANGGLTGVFKVLLSLPINLLLLAGSILGANNTINFNSPLWFVTNIILFLPIISFVCLKIPNVFKYILCWFLPLLLYSYNIETINQAITWQPTVVQIYTRSIAAMMLGGLGYYLVSNVKNKSFSRLAIYVSPVLCLCMMLVMIFSKSSGMGHIINYIILVVLVTYVILVGSIDIPKRLTTVFKYLGKLALPIYCIHYPIEELVQISVPYFSYTSKLSLSIVVSIILSIILVSIFTSTRKIRNS